MDRGLFTNTILAGLLIFFLGIAAPEYSYAQKNEKREEKKNQRKSRRRLQGQQAKFSRWDKKYQDYMLQRSVRDQRLKPGRRRRISVSSSPAIYAQPDPYAGRKFRSERQRMSRIQGSLGTEPRTTQRPPKKTRIRTSSASGRYIVNKRPNPYRFRDKDRWEKTYSGGFYGRRAGITPQNTQRISAAGQPDPYRKRGRRGDKPYEGVIQGGAVSATRSGERAWKGDIAGQPVRGARTRSRQRINVYPTVSPYTRARRTEGERISRSQDFYGSTPRDPQGPPGKKRRNVRSATGNFIVQRKAKPYKLRDRKKWEETYTGGFYGRRSGISPVNTQRVSEVAQPNPYAKRGRLGDKPYRGVISGGFNTATKPGEIAWRGDVAGRRIRHSQPRNTQRAGVSAGRRVATASGGLHNNGGRAIRTAGGGSVSAQMKRNNEGKALTRSFPGNAALGATRYSGKIHAEEIYFKFGSAHLQYEGDIPVEELSMGFSTDHINFSGDIKAKKPVKGGGSLSRNNWNNSGKALAQRYGDKNSRVAGSFGGTLKASKPQKGGGTASRIDVWNNNESPLEKKHYNKNVRVAGSFGGSIKASKPRKGAGSASRDEAWNNDDSALEQKYGQAKGSGFSGNVKLKTGYARNKKSSDDALMVRRPQKSHFAAGSFTGKTKQERRKINGQLHASTKLYNSGDDGNSVEEKKKIFSLKLLWNKIFGKDTPEEENERKPRYDKREKGIWNE